MALTTALTFSPEMCLFTICSSSSACVMVQLKVTFVLHSFLHCCICDDLWYAHYEFGPRPELAGVLLTFFFARNVTQNISQSQCNVLPSLISPAGLRVANLNCCSLLSVADEVFDLFSIDVFAITETWLNSFITDNEINFFLIPHLLVFHVAIGIVMVMG